LIETKSIKKKYKKGGFFSKSCVYAIKDISVSVCHGENIGILGESGAGKSTLARILSLLEPPSSGSVFVDSKKITKSINKTLRRKIGVIFQNPFGSLDPRIKILSALQEALKDKKDINKIYEYCQIADVKMTLLGRYPNQLSGGEQQRVAIARSLIADPDYIIFDEATSSLDVSTQARIMNMLVDLKSRKNYSYIFISHDLKLTTFIADRIYILYAGYVIEETDYVNIYNKPLHPYTKMLIGSDYIEHIDGGFGKNACPFYSFCKFRKKICSANTPNLIKMDSIHSVRCFLYD